MGYGAVWLPDPELAGDYSLLRASANTRGGSNVSFDAGCINVEIGEAGLWCWLQQQDGGGTLAQIDPSSGAVLERKELTFDLVQFAVGSDSLWVLDQQHDAVWEIDASNGVVRNVVPVGRSPEAVVVSEGAVWVANGGERSVSRVDTETLDVRVIDVGGVPDWLAATADSVWVRVAPDPSEQG